jgi:radical SAM protein with 4Fe4S-binding SPASM domain
MTPDDEIVHSVLSRTFFKGWCPDTFGDALYENYRGLEVQVNGKCNLDCKYCYYTNFQDKIYPTELADPKKILWNLKLLLGWLEDNGLCPNMDVFSAEPFAQEVGFVATEMVLDFLIRNPRRDKQAVFVIPTNFSFLMSDILTKKVERLLCKGRENGIDFRLSASIDGKYMDEINRPFKNGRKRDDEFYNKAFAFAYKWNCAFHPMIYGNGIERAIDNFNWFQEMLERFSLSWHSIYLLEVRNWEWSREQLKHYYEFMRYVVRFMHNKLGSKDFVKTVFGMKCMNMLINFFKIGRGTGCSVQGVVQVRLADLTHHICHRASYSPHALWKFEEDGKRITGLKAINPELFVAWASMDEDAFPYCQHCLIKHVCTGQCLGSMYEVNRSLFLPIPTVCALEHMKVASQLDELDALGVVNDLYSFCQPNVVEACELYFSHYRRPNGL